MISFVLHTRENTYPNFLKVQPKRSKVGLFKYKKNEFQKKKKSGKPIDVILRIKPSEFDFDHICVHGKHIRIHSGDDTFSNFYSKIFDRFSTQEEVFEYIKKEVIDKTYFQGINTCLLSCGSIDSGKSYTLLGGTEKMNRGIIPRAAKYLFKNMCRNCHEGVEYRLYFSMCEIFKDNINDLLDDIIGKKLIIKEKKNVGNYIENLSVLGMENYKQFNEFFLKGIQKRKRKDKMSGSHLIAQFFIVRYKLQSNLKFFKGERLSKITFIDMAGKNRYDNFYDDLNYSIPNTKDDFEKILRINNLSYMRLEKITNDILEQKKYISYRDEKLTHFLKDSLTGNCKTTIMSNIDSNSKQITETISTLNFVEKFKFIRTNYKSQKNRNVQVFVDDLKQEVKTLYNHLEKFREEETKKINKFLEDNSKKEKERIKSAVEIKLKQIKQKHDNVIIEKESKIENLEHKISSLKKWKELDSLKIQDKEDDIKVLKRKIIELKVNNLKQINNKMNENDNSLKSLKEKINMYEQLFVDFRNKKIEPQNLNQ